MVIPVIKQLASRDQWMDFCRRETAYCFVEQPQVLVDLQSTFLKITLLPDHQQLQDAVKYSLGSRTSIEPVWQLIKGCHWDLSALIRGLQELDFSSNVRDNSLLKAHTDLSVRKYFSRERCLVAPESLGLLEPLMAAPDVWSSFQLNRLINNGQFRDLRSEQKLLSDGRSYGGVDAPEMEQIRMLLLNPQEQLIGQQIDTRLHVYRNQQPFISLIPEFRWPQPRLKKKPA
ncbi:hypothetical protein [Neptuniibacter halophilus]|uniref:hypothetical protein n=1 Tax=Neptuniibacter halophilus TaxID=651666 RepID=UPI002574203A|nr:hypothetical protein [Neptuniibacter halophilus]